MTALLLDSDLPTLQGHHRRPSLSVSPRLLVLPLPSVHHGGSTYPSPLSPLVLSLVDIAIPSVLHPGLTDPGVEERVTLAEKKPTDRAIERDQLAAQETHQRG